MERGQDIKWSYFISCPLCILYPVLSPFYILSSLNTMAKRTDNTMAKRTDNTMTKRTDNTMAKRTDNTMAKITENTMSKEQTTQ
jgi:hypothetical protein